MCSAGICEVAKYRNGSTDSRGESLPANTFKWRGQLLFYIFSLFVVIFIDYTRHWSILTFIFQVKFSELPQLCSNQEETDTRVVLYLHHTVNLGYKNAVVRTPDTDVLVILLYHAHTITLTIYLDSGSGKHRKVINLSNLAGSLGESYCETLLGFSVFTEEDCNSSFKWKGKVAPLKRLEENPRIHKCFRQLGDDQNVNADVLKEVEKFTCLMYVQSRETSVDGARVKLLRKMVGNGEKLISKSKDDVGRLPQCYSALRPHF